mmetsp:Transcript_6963/g.14344  ORF Transcript_6963/g.14344 Transcript_6963/m.14344 type:complete len:106 (-) Transcript_6963:88-405(-)
MNATAKKNLNKTNNSMLIDFHPTRWLNTIGLNDSKIMQSSVIYRERRKNQRFSCPPINATIPTAIFCPNLSSYEKYELPTFIVTFFEFSIPMARPSQQSESGKQS